MNKKEIKWLKTTSSHISQIYSSGLEYCFVSDDLHQSHPFVYCKDFLQDAVHGFIHKKTADIYGFKYNPEMPLCTRKTRILLGNSSDAKFLEKVPNTIDFVNQFAKKLHLKKTRVFEATNPPKKYKSGVILTSGSPMWMNSPPLLSMYTLLMRVGFVHHIGTDALKTIDDICTGKLRSYQKEDSVQLGGAMSGINNILKVGYRKFFFIDSSKNYPAGEDVDTLHNCCGIMGFSSGETRNVVKYWHRKSLKQSLEAKK